MCGRYSLGELSFGEIAAFLRGTAQTGVVEKFLRSWNISPTSNVLGMRLEDGERILDYYRWGLVPPWSDELPKFPTHNARVETVATKPTYEHAYSSGQRVLIPADGYYEWQILTSGPKPEKQPWYISSAKDAGLAFAGLYDWWRSKDSGDPWLASCTIVTTTPGPDVVDIHDRQPVVLPPDQWDVWLDSSTDVEEARSLLVPAPSGTFSRRRVGKAVGNSRSEGQRLIDEVEPEVIQTLF